MLRKTLALSGASAVIVALATATAGNAATSDNTTMTFNLVVKGANTAGLADFATKVAMPGTPEFRKFKSDAELANEYGATTGDFLRAKAWARDHGFIIQATDKDQQYLTVTAPARVARAEFGDMTQKTTANSLAKPAGPFQDVTYVPTVSAHTNSVMRPRYAKSGCAHYWGEHNDTSLPQKYPSGFQSASSCGYNYAQIRGLYGLSDADTGSGQSIVITDAFLSPTLIADANQVFAQSGAPALTDGQVMVKSYDKEKPETKQCAHADWYGEANLDLVAAHTIAPNAKIVYVAAPSCDDLESTMDKTINDNSLNSTLISNSWGAEEAGTAFGDRAYLNRMFSRAAAKGIGLYFASGDDGSAASPTSTDKSVQLEAASTYITSVGGTSSAVGADDTPVFETGWENGVDQLKDGAWTPFSPYFNGGSSGGASSFYDQPAWQAGHVPGNLAGGHRAIPDIAALGDANTGILVGYTSSGKPFQLNVAGGTSLAAPLVTALVADSQAKNGNVIGQLAPTLYAKGKSNNLITDVTHVNAGIVGFQAGGRSQVVKGTFLNNLDSGGQGLATAPGWNNVTGLGRPGANFIDGLGQ
jgi:subtilase family serine protease